MRSFHACWRHNAQDELPELPSRVVTLMLEVPTLGGRVARADVDGIANARYHVAMMLGGSGTWGGVLVAFFKK